jgi:2-amino-4-hydroxy-6-hydroxymethyldihydropteridine diphosphokinase
MVPQEALGPSVHDGRVGDTEMAWIGLGANVGAARGSLEAGVAALAALPATELRGVSRLYRTRPVGPVAQDDFLNAVIGLRVPATAVPADGAMAVLVALKSLERAMGRVERERWGPRELDLDLLLYGSHQLRVERAAAARSVDPARSGVQWLEVPHPEASRRSFVLAPLADLAPDLHPPGWGETVTTALERARALERADAVRAVADWDARLGRWVDPAAA